MAGRRRERKGGAELAIAGLGPRARWWERWQLPMVVLARVLGVLGIIGVGFLAFLIFTSNPFARLLPAPLEGHDLNPLLQDIGLIVHPPMLYMGYVGFSVAFAFAIAVFARANATGCS